MNETVVMQMGCMVRALPLPELEKLPLLLETLEGIDHCGWNESQVMYKKKKNLHSLHMLVTHHVTVRPCLSRWKWSGRLLRNVTTWWPSSWGLQRWWL